MLRGEGNDPKLLGERPSTFVRWQAGAKKTKKTQSQILSSPQRDFLLYGHHYIKLLYLGGLPQREFLVWRRIAYVGASPRIGILMWGCTYRRNSLCGEARIQDVVF